MTKAEIEMLQSELFSASANEAGGYVIEQRVPMVSEHYHDCRKHCPRPLAFAQNELGLSKEVINSHKICLKGESIRKVLAECGGDA